MLKQDIVREATRLTRAGQLVKATVLLQRMLRGESTPDATSRTTARTALAGREPPIIDAKANTIEEKDRPHLARATSAQPRMLRALFDGPGERPGLRRRSVIKRAPLSTPDIVPEGARFIAVATAIRREAVPTGCSSPAVIRGSRFLWWSCFTAVPSRQTISPPVRG
jgi:hypothetical protein